MCIIKKIQLYHQEDAKACRMFFISVSYRIFGHCLVHLIKSHFKDVLLEVVSYKEVALEHLQPYNRIIFSPGPQLPQDYPILYDILKTYDTQIPILGICLGHQAICNYYGAAIRHLGRVVHGESSLISCDPTSLLFKGMNTAVVGRYHSWAAYDIPNTLRITAKTADDVVMAVEHKHKAVFGVQFHPESVISNCGVDIIRHFIYDVRTNR